MDIPTGARPANIGKTVLITIVDKDKNGRLMLNTMKTFVGVLKAYQYDVENFLFLIDGFLVAVVSRFEEKHVEIHNTYTED